MNYDKIIGDSRRFMKFLLAVHTSEIEPPFFSYIPEDQIWIAEWFNIEKSMLLNIEQDEKTFSIYAADLNMIKAESENNFFYLFYTGEGNPPDDGETYLSSDVVVEAAVKTKSWLIRNMQDLKTDKNANLVRLFN